MTDLTLVADAGRSLTDDAVRRAVVEQLSGQLRGQRVLVLVPDHTRTAPLPLLFSCLVETLHDAARLDVLVALGTHPPLSDDRLNALVGITAEERAGRYAHVGLFNHAWEDPDALTTLGVKSGDKVAIYMGMVPEAVVAMLACARIGATHSVIFGGFAPDAVRDRVNDADCRVILTQDGAWRRGHVVPLKENVDKALPQCPGVKHVVVYRRTKNEIAMQKGRDHEWSELMAATWAVLVALPDRDAGDGEDLPESIGAVLTGTMNFMGDRIAGATWFLTDYDRKGDVANGYLVVPGNDAGAVSEHGSIYGRNLIGQGFAPVPFPSGLTFRDVVNVAMATNDDGDAMLARLLSDAVSV